STVFPEVPPPARSTPVPVFPEIRFRAAAIVPPTVFPAEPAIRTPTPFARATEPAGSVPITFPATFTPDDDAPAISTPALAFPEITFRAPDPVPPIRSPEPDTTRTPTEFPNPALPAASVPTRFPATTSPSPARRSPTVNRVTSSPSTWLEPASNRNPVHFLPPGLSTRTSGDPAKPGCERPLITTGSVTAGSAADVTAIVWTPDPGSPNRITSAPGFAFASRIACRSEPDPESAVVVTTKVCPDAAPAEADDAVTARAASA